MKTSTIPTLLGPDGMTSLREYAGYHGGGSGFGGQLRAWNPPGESVDAALLPNFTRGNARADDLVRNNGYAANAIQLHQDHIVGSFFRLSHRPSWRYLGIGEEEARAFSREVESAWKEFAEDDCCCIDVERKRTFTMMIREGVAMHAFNGELFVQATWDTSPSRLFRTQFRMVCVAGRLRANLPVVGPYCLRNRTALNRIPTAPAHPVQIWGRKPHRRLITALNPRITLVRIPIV